MHATRSAVQYRPHAALHSPTYFYPQFQLVEIVMNDSRTSSLILAFFACFFLPYFGCSLRQAPTITTLVASSPPRSVPFDTTNENPQAPMNVYYGLLHAHTAFSDGSGTPEEAFAMAKGRDFTSLPLRHTTTRKPSMERRDTEETAS